MKLLLLCFLLVDLAQARILTDLRHKNVSFTTANRVVALMPAIAETLSEMGADHSLIGIPDYTDVSSENTKHIKILGPYPHISAEEVYLLKPDLVIANIDGNDPLLVKKLEDLKLAVLVIDTRSLDKISQSFLLLSEVIATATAKSKVTFFVKALSDFKKSVPLKTRTVFLQLGWQPLVSASPNTFIGEILTLAGLDNISRNEKITYPRPSVESVIASNPDMIVICPFSKNQNESSTAVSFWRKFPQIKAVKTSSIHIMPLGALTKPSLSMLNAIRTLKELP